MRHATAILFSLVFLGQVFTSCGAHRIRSVQSSTENNLSGDLELSNPVQCSDPHPGYAIKSISVSPAPLTAGKAFNVEVLLANQTKASDSVQLLIREAQSKKLQYSSIEKKATRGVVGFNVGARTLNDAGTYHIIAKSCNETRLVQQLVVAAAKAQTPNAKEPIVVSDPPPPKDDSDSFQGKYDGSQVNIYFVGGGPVNPKSDVYKTLESCNSLLANYSCADEYNSGTSHMTSDLTTIRRLAPKANISVYLVGYFGHFFELKAVAEALTQIADKAPGILFLAGEGYLYQDYKEYYDSTFKPRMKRLIDKNFIIISPAGDHGKTRNNLTATDRMPHVWQKIWPNSIFIAGALDAQQNKLDSSGYNAPVFLYTSGVASEPSTGARFLIPRPSTVTAAAALTGMMALYFQSKIIGSNKSNLEILQRNSVKKSDPVTGTQMFILQRPDAK